MDLDHARPAPEPPRQLAQQRRLAAARGAAQQHRLRGAERERHRAQRRLGMRRGHDLAAVEIGRARRNDELGTHARQALRQSAPGLRGRRELQRQRAARRIRGSRLSWQQDRWGGSRVGDDRAAQEGGARGVGGAQAAADELRCLAAHRRRRVREQRQQLTQLDSSAQRLAACGEQLVCGTQ
jgi:hypothetical protein